MPQRIRLLATCQVNGALHYAGEIVTLPDGQRGPHRSVVASSHGAALGDVASQNLIDDPLFVVVDEGIEKEREEMRARQAEERNKLDHTDERAALVRKQGEEAAAFEIRSAETELHTRQEQEAATLKDRQTAENVAFDKRAETVPLANPPVEVNKEELTKRQAAETEALQKRQAEEKLVLEARKANVWPAAGAQAPYVEMTDAELAAWNRSKGRLEDDQTERLQRNRANAQSPAAPLPPRQPARAAFEAPPPVPAGFPARPL
jgi:hypothetical protein